MGGFVDPSDISLSGGTDGSGALSASLQMNADASMPELASALSGMGAQMRAIGSQAANLSTTLQNDVQAISDKLGEINDTVFAAMDELENRDLVPECVGMIQKEVAVRLAEPPGSKEYGILSVLLQAWYDIEYLFTVNETVFNPPPKVKSAVIRLRRNATERLGCDETLFVKVVKASFGQRRKMIRNSLKSVFGDFGGAEHPFFTRRAEQLGVAEFVELTNWVSRFSIL